VLRIFEVREWLSFKLQFMFRLLEILAKRFQPKKIITEFYCQEFAQLVKIMYSLSSDHETDPRLCAACQRGALARGERLKTFDSKMVHYL